MPDQAERSALTVHLFGCDPLTLIFQYEWNILNPGFIGFADAVRNRRKPGKERRTLEIFTGKG